MNFKPQATGYLTHQWNISSEEYSIFTERRLTYQKLLSEVVRPQLLKGNVEKVAVIKSKRGNWGEWFEEWRNVCNKSGNLKPIKVKEGWM